jgi:GMP synthase (glutamine-hydrolysing)
METIANSTLSLRAVKTLDFMSAEVRTDCLLGLKFLALTSLQPYEFDFGLLKKISTRIVNEVDGIARVTYNITSKPPGQLLFTLFSTPWADRAEQGHI